MNRSDHFATCRVKASHYLTSQTIHHRMGGLRRQQITKHKQLLLYVQSPSLSLTKQYLVQLHMSCTRMTPRRARGKKRSQTETKQSNQQSTADPTGTTVHVSNFFTACFSWYGLCTMLIDPDHKGQLRMGKYVQHSVITFTQS